MLQILAITTPIFILIGIGFLATRSGLVSREQINGMGRFVVTLALPALVIKALIERPLHEVFDRNYLLAYGLGSLAMFVLGFLFARLLRRDSISGSAITALGMSMSNSGFIGYPVVALVVGETAAVGLALGMLVENLLMFPLGLMLAEAGEQLGAGLKAALLGTAKRLLSNPLILSISLGLLLALLDVRLPAIPLKVVDMLAQASAPVALFVIGGSLVGLKAGGLLGDVLQVSIGKLILHPLAVLLLFSWFPVQDPALRIAGVLFACSPMMSIYPIIGQRFGLAGRCAAALLGATLLSFLTINAFIAWLGGPLG
ncbi:AEC family transporter [Pseudomonas sp. R-28-1W-6]|uniref:AEC family transporter n=1 Tax=Pseudomonas sp. R-28-1W-6 TaxID=2650101 RepID=UPI0013651F78|nr:AEC family transporter [Pseudomonas sp. R-28-1W-6]MWV14383.1 AEC family transporter [Pseudomonas sp. R-28-1W-6]